MSVKYTKEHEWCLIEGESARIGISNYAQKQLGDVVFVELPEIGKKVKKGEESAVIESVKAAGEIYAPLTGEVVEVNESLSKNPAFINEKPLEAWIYRLTISSHKEAESLMDEDQYQNYLESLE